VPYPFHITVHHGFIADHRRTHSLQQIDQDLSSNPHIAARPLSSFTKGLSQMNGTALFFYRSGIYPGISERDFYNFPQNPVEA
jgi:hypothetical protein